MTVMMKNSMVFVGALVTLGCESGGGGGAELSVRAWGEEYIEEGIPADVFNDGWTVQFDRFLINVGQIEVGEVEGAPAFEVPQFQVYDLAVASNGEGQFLGKDEAPAGTYADTQYRIYPAEGDSTAGNATSSDVKMMQDGGYSVFVAGSATKNGVTKTFTWGFNTRTAYSHCQSQAVIEADVPAAVQITIHGDHLFYDDLYSETPMVLFSLYAQADDDGDADGVISREELEAVDLRSLPNYQVGSTDITDLWNFVEHLTTSLGHIDGEGHCMNVRES
ncbi:MAG: hypothetical protein JNL82_32270 [Myxococcales bacterium]|nr:hypothetical protein [Myxococcales bacterium]